MQAATILMLFQCGDKIVRDIYKVVPSSSNRVAPLANEEIQQMARRKRWNNRRKDTFMMKKMKSVI